MDVERISETSAVL